ncbi:MAG: hypothetical protein JWL90_329 [Chthoniobacteraceae bacterium]|nr:hypothetical protein [Chthoniobacteraceae bacterium]
MRNEEFVEKSTSGFLVELTRTNFIEARFIERFERTETISNPFGESEEFQRIEYQVTHFRLSVDPPQLEFYDSPRSVSPAINRLTAIVGVESVVKPLLVDVAKWLAALDKSVTEIRVTAAHIARLSLSETVNARVVLKGTEDVRRFAEDMVGVRAYKFERLEISGVYQGFPVRFDLRDDARASLSSGGEEILEVLRRSLAESL